MSGTCREREASSYLQDLNLQFYCCRRKSKESQFGVNHVSLGYTLWCLLNRHILLLLHYTLLLHARAGIGSVLKIEICSIFQAKIGTFQALFRQIQSNLQFSSHILLGLGGGSLKQPFHSHVCVQFPFAELPILAAIEPVENRPQCLSAHALIAAHFGEFWFFKVLGRIEGCGFKK